MPLFFTDFHSDPKLVTFWFSFNSQPRLLIGKYSWDLMFLIALKTEVKNPCPSLLSWASNWKYKCPIEIRSLPSCNQFGPLPCLLMAQCACAIPCLPLSAAYGIKRKRGLSSLLRSCLNVSLSAVLKRQGTKSTVPTKWLWHLLMNFLFIELLCQCLDDPLLTENNS